MAKKIYTRIFREQFVTTWLWNRQETTLSAHSERFGVSRETAYDWIAKYEQQGMAGLETKSCAPLTVPHRTDDEIVKLLISAREHHPTWGPKKLKAWLEQTDPFGLTLPAASTIGAILKRAGLVTTRKRRRRITRYAEPFVEAVAPNDVWTTDFKGQFRTRDKRHCYPLTLVDDFSRFILRCDAYLAPDEKARQSFESAFLEYGLPAVIRSDNGSPFAVAATPAGLSSLSVWWIRLGIRPERIAPASPWENARHERMHRTLKAEATNPPQARRRQQQKTFDSFVREFNEERPHEALGMKPPATVFTRSKRRYSRKLAELEYQPGHELRRVTDNGTINWDGHRVFLTNVLRNQIVGAKQKDECSWELYFGPVLLGSLHRKKNDLGFRSVKR